MQEGISLNFLNQKRNKEVFSIIVSPLNNVVPSSHVVLSQLSVTFHPICLFGKKIQPKRVQKCCEMTRKNGKW